MKKLKVFVTMLLPVLLTGCQTLSCMNKETLVVFNWGEYVDEATISAFEEEYGVCVDYVKFTSNESAYVKMQTSTYDVIFPSDYMIERLAKEDMILELDWSKITGFDRENDISSVTTEILNKLKSGDSGFDFLKYAAPYFSGQVGILYDTTVEGLEEDVKSDGWEVFRNNKYRVAYYDSSRDGFMVPLSELGYDINTNVDSEIANAKNWLLEQQTNLGGNLSYVTDEVLDDMVNARYDLALVYSGDANYIIGENSDMAFYRPNNKATNVFVDGMVIQKQSEKVDLAYKFISHMLSYESSKANSIYVGYTSTRKDVFEELSDSEFSEVKDSYHFEFNPLDSVYRYPGNQEKLDSEWSLILASHNK